jgi:hypothetical protein
VPGQDQQQHQASGNHVQPLPFIPQPQFSGFFPMPPMLAMPAIPTIPPLMPIPAYPPPLISIPSMFPTTALQNTTTPFNQSSTTTSFPGGQTIQQTSSHSGQQGNTTFQYSSSSTSMSFDPGVQLPPTLQPGLPAVTYSTRFVTPAPPPLLQQQTLLQPQNHHQQQPTQQSIPHHHQELPMRSRDPDPVQHTPMPAAAPAAVPPETLFNPVMEDVVDQEPQNPRLAETFRRQLESDEATYFSPVPGRADRKVQR